MNINVVSDVYSRYFAVISTNQNERPIHKIKGKVMVLSHGFPCSITLHDRKTRNVLRETISKQDGGYVFAGLPLSNFFIMALHLTQNYNAVIQDNVVPK